MSPGDDLRRPLEDLKILAAAIAVLALVAGAAFGLQGVLIPRPAVARVEAAELSGQARALALRADARHLVPNVSARKPQLSLVFSRTGDLPVQLFAAVRGISGTSVVHFVAWLRHRRHRA